MNGGAASKGKMVSKDEHTFTLQDEKGNKIVISDLTPKGQIFKTKFQDTTNPAKIKDIILADIPVGADLLGEFWVFKGGKILRSAGVLALSLKIALSKLTKCLNV